jgi:hypothetical protein
VPVAVPVPRLRDAVDEPVLAAPAPDVL